MIYRGKVQCKYCNKISDWFYHKPDSGENRRLPATVTIPDSDVIIVAPNSNTISRVVLVGYCSCGTEVAIEYDLDTNKEIV